MLRALLTSPEFAASAGRKTRRPYEDGIATLRVLGAGHGGGTEGWGNLVWCLKEQGQHPLAWPQPDGYPDVASAWAGTGSVLQRWNFHLGVAQRWMKEGLAWPDLRQHLLPAVPATRDQLVQALFDRLLPGLSVPTAHRDALVTFLGGPGPVKDADVGWLFPVLVALFLDSPHWSVR